MDYPSGWPGMSQSLTGNPDLDATLTASNAQVPQSAAPVAPVAKVKKKAPPTKPMVVAPTPPKINRTSETEDDKDTDTSSDSETDTTTNRQGQKASTTQKAENIKTDNQTEGVKAGTFNPVVSGDTMQFLRDTPEYKDNQSSMGDLQNLLDMEAKLPAGKAFDPWVQPMLMLADAQTGSQMSKDYKEPPNPNDRMKLLLKYQDDLAKRKADAFKTLVQASPHLINGSIFDRLMTGDRSIVGNAATQANSQSQTTGQSNTTADKQTTEQGTKSMQGSGFPTGAAPHDIFNEAYTKQVATDLAKFSAEGGANKIDLNIGYLGSAIQKLKAAQAHPGTLGMGVSGAGQGFLSGIGLGDYANINDAATIKSLIDNVSIAASKESFGPRVTQQEVQMLKDLRFNPRLSEGENIKILVPALNLLQDIKTRYNDMTNFGMQRGSMKGFKPAVTSPQGFQPGAKRIQDGVTYVRQRDGTWHPMGE